MSICPKCSYGWSYQLGEGRLKCRSCGHRRQVTKTLWDTSRLDSRIKTQLVQRFVWFCHRYKVWKKIDRMADPNLQRQDDGLASTWKKSIRGYAFRSGTTIRQRQIKRWQAFQAGGRGTQSPYPRHSGRTVRIPRLRGHIHGAGRFGLQCRQGYNLSPLPFQGGALHGADAGTAIAGSLTT